MTDELKRGDIVALGTTGHQAWIVVNRGSYGVRIQTERTARVIKDPSKLRELQDQTTQTHPSLRALIR